MSTPKPMVTSEMPFFLQRFDASANSSDSVTPTLALPSVRKITRLVRSGSLLSRVY